MLFQKVIYHRNDLNINGDNYIVRKAIRGVIIKNGNILLIHLEGSNEYKFPGGGANGNETAEQILVREILEEAGAVVKKISQKIGEVVEYNRKEEDEIDYFKMVSEYYDVEIEDELQSQNLDPWEKDLEFVPKWIEIQEALNANIKNMEIHGSNKSKWIERETYVLGELNSYYIKK